MYKYMYICIYMYANIYTCIHMYTCMYLYIQIRQIHIELYIHVHTYESEFYGRRTLRKPYTSIFGAFGSHTYLYRDII